MSCVSIKAERLDGIRISVSLVCDTRLRKYLRVTPGLVWVTPEEITPVGVLSNTSWEVE